MNLQVGMASLLCAILPSLAGADPLRLVPAAADAVARVENPRALYNAIYEHELFQDFLKIDTVAAFYDTTNFRRAQQFIAFLEKELGHERLDLLDRLAGGGATVAAQFEQKAVLLVVEAKDEELLKQFVALARKLANQELSRQDAKATIQARSYRDLETLHLGTDLHAARAGSALLISNQESVLHKALDLYRDGAKDSLAQTKSLAEMKSHLPKEPLLWGALNIEQIKTIQNVKNTLNTLGLDPVTMFAIGGVVDVIKRSPYVCAGLAREGNNLHLRVAMPRGSDGMAPLAAMFLPADDRGTLPML
ncbi:MAG TPA: DUF3352 domain-containing protein, partial [Gemmataceae bacterium]|nr:DUF3352 domain-containing protein [Gemmataceae bacterium]